MSTLDSLPARIVLRNGALLIIPPMVITFGLCLLFERLHLSDISHWAYGVGLFQLGTLIPILVNAIPVPLFRRQE